MISVSEKRALFLQSKIWHKESASKLTILFEEMQLNYLFFNLSFSFEWGNSWLPREQRSQFVLMILQKERDFNCMNSNRSL